MGLVSEHVHLCENFILQACWHSGADGGWHAHLSHHLLSYFSHAQLHTRMALPAGGAVLHRAARTAEQLASAACWSCPPLLSQADQPQRQRSEPQKLCAAGEKAAETVQARSASPSCKDTTERSNRPFRSPLLTDGGQILMAGVNFQAGHGPLRHQQVSSWSTAP